MKSLELEMLGVQEMNACELIVLDGACPLYIREKHLPFIGDRINVYTYADSLPTDELLP